MYMLMRGNDVFTWDGQRVDAEHWCSAKNKEANLNTQLHARSFKTIRPGRQGVDE